MASQKSLKEIEELLHKYNELDLNDEQTLKQQLTELKGRIAQIEGKISVSQSPAVASDIKSPAHKDEEDIEEYEDRGSNGYGRDVVGEEEEEEEYRAPGRRKRVLTVEQQREKGLFEIFNFYSKQHIMQGGKMTFDDIGKEGSKLCYADFLKLCADFGLPGKKEVLTEIYRLKVMRGHQSLDFGTFKECMAEVFRRKHFEPIEKAKAELKALTNPAKAQA